jgi:hypothetical protein
VRLPSAFVRPGEPRALRDGRGPARPLGLVPVGRRPSARSRKRRRTTAGRRASAVTLGIRRHQREASDVRRSRSRVSRKETRTNRGAAGGLIGCDQRTLSSLRPVKPAWGALDAADRARLLIKRAKTCTHEHIGPIPRFKDLSRRDKGLWVVPSGRMGLERRAPAETSPAAILH